MQKEFISDRQAISLIILLIIGESSIFTEGIAAGKDLWISIILAIIITLPVVLVFARLHVLFPGETFFDIIQFCFGKYLGKALIILFIWFCFYTVALILEDLGYFITTVAFPETPFLIPIYFFALLCSFGVKHGIEVIGRVGEFFIAIPVILELIAIPLLISEMNINNILPILSKGVKPIIEGTFLSSTFPFLYIVGFMMIFSHFKDRNSPYKMYITGLFTGGILVLITSVIGILVVGESSSSTLYFPTYVAVSRINIGQILQRLEIISAIIFLLGIYIEACIFLLGACRGIAKLFEFPDYRFIVMPVTLLVVNVCAIEYSSIMRYFEWSREIWPYYAFPFEVILPIIIWIMAEIKVRRLQL